MIVMPLFDEQGRCVLIPVTSVKYVIRETETLTAIHFLDGDAILVKENLGTIQGKMEGRK